MVVSSSSESIVNPFKGMRYDFNLEAYVTKSRTQKVDRSVDARLSERQTG